MDDSDVDERIRALESAHRAALSFLDSIDDRPVWPRASLEDMIDAFGGPLAEHGIDPAEVIAEMAEQADPGLVAIPGGRFFGFVIGATHPAALAADWLVSAWDQNSGSSTLTPATVAMERVAGQWMLELFGLPSSASVGFVTGGQLANFTCLATARHAVLARAGWDIAEQGFRGAPPLRFVVGADRHGSIDRAARFLGIGRAELTIADSDDQGRMRADALERTLAAADGPLIVCLQAGEVHTGAFDDFDALISIAKEHGAWVHVDGAFGLWAAASDSLRPLTTGMEKADPWDVTPELSRRARGVPAWAAMRSLGSSGIAALIDRLHDNAVAMAAGLASIDEIEILNDVDYTQVMFRAESDAATRALGEAILVDGTAAVTGAEWRGRAALRCSMSSWATTPDDITRTIEAIRQLVAR